MDRYVEECQSDCKFKGKQKKSLSSILGRNPSLLAQMCWPSGEGSFPSVSVCIKINRNGVKRCF